MDDGDLKSPIRRQGSPLAIFLNLVENEPLLLPSSHLIRVKRPHLVTTFCYNLTNRGGMAVGLSVRVVFPRRIWKHEYGNIQYV